MTDTSKFKTGQDSLSLAPLRKATADVYYENYVRNENARPEVITVARFIANLEPSYINSQGTYITLSQIRSIPHSEEDVKFLCEKFEEIVKPYITVTNKTEINKLKLNIKTTMSKKRLIHAAVRHLLTGCEVVDSFEHYLKVVYYSVYPHTIKQSYAFLLGMALGLDYPSVQAMMDDFCLTFIDQTETVMKTGEVVLYDGVIKTEKL